MSCRRARPRLRVLLQAAFSPTGDPTACVRPANWAAANQVCAQGLDRRSRSTFVAGRRANRFASLLFWCFAGCSPQQRPGAVPACMRTDVLSAACTSNMTSCRFDTDLCLQICFVLADSRFSITRSRELFESSVMTN